MANTFKLSTDQIIGSTVDFINQERIQKLKEELARILANETSAINQQNQSLIEALAQVKNIRDFLNSPENILGSNLTKHGEIAEQIEVGIRNARDLIEGRQPTATFDGVGRTAPEDYIIDGIKVQSKFINGINNNLDHVIKHMNKYPDFVQEGSYYHIPKDTYQKIQQILDGNPPPDLSSRTVNKILEKVAEIEKKSGKSFSDVVKPSVSDYNEVQRGVVNDTLNKHEADLKARSKQKIEDIRKNADKEREKAQQKSKPNLQEGIKAGLIGAAISGGMNIALFVYKKHREGKNIFQFDENDWRDLGIDFAKGGAKGGITGFSIYALTNFTNMSAPMASAFVSSAFGISKLATDLSEGKISMSDFIVQGQLTCLESGMVALGATVGQTMIPIPIIGTLIGSFATSILMNLTKKYLTDKENEVIAKLEEIYNEALSKIQYEYQKIVAAIIEEYHRLGTITKMAFDFECNAVFRFDQSKKLAIASGVEEHKILKTINDIDNYFLM